MKWLKSGIFLVFILSVALAVPLPSADEESLRLPKSSIPLSYDLSLKTSVDKGERAFSGFVKIEIEIQEPTDFITLHNRGLIIETIEVFGSSGQKLEISYEADESKEFLIVESLIRTLQVGEGYTIEIAYNGMLQRGSKGFYILNYSTGGYTK
jgi:aminopeptidase N